MLEASNEIAIMLAKKHRHFPDCEDIVKPCFIIITKWFGYKSIQRNVNDIALQKQIITWHIEETFVMYLSNRSIVSTHVPTFH